MSQLNDCIVATLIAGGYGDQINDGLLAWCQANGATVNQLNDAMVEAALANGGVTPTLNDAWFEALRSQGYTGALNDMLWDFWCTGGGAFGFAAIGAAMGVTNDKVVVTFNDVPQNFNPIAGVVIEVDGVDDLNAALAPVLNGNSLTYTLNSVAPVTATVIWKYQAPPGIISDGTDLAGGAQLVAQEGVPIQENWWAINETGTDFWSIEDDGSDFWSIEVESLP